MDLPHPAHGDLPHAAHGLPLSQVVARLGSAVAEIVTPGPDPVVDDVEPHGVPGPDERLAVTVEDETPIVVAEGESVDLGLGDRGER